ncbi:methyl-accepting chemotaxis protein [Actinoplanes sichuanensis]|uniref:Methyl-accepting chemotaxis protein n=1 Tax=Actinoplanes sichuanensis TaxID=512349 RepID=A0ABW4A417_9ACTN|nr:methyl-accepting chemotaxis protein [Actinoplanes sichuanensis]
MAVGGAVRSLSLRASMLLTSAVALLAAVVAAVVGVERMDAIADRAQSIYAESLVPVSTVQDIQQLIWHSRWASLSNLTATDPAKAAVYADETKAQLDLVSVRLDEYRGLTVTAAERAAMTTFEDSWGTYLELRDQSSALKKAGKLEEWQAFRSSTLNPALAQVIADLDALRTLSQQQAQAQAVAARSAAGSARIAILAALAVGVLLAGVVSVLMARALSRRLDGLGAVLAAMADGDLTERQADSAGNEIGRMSRSVHRVATQMRATMSTLAAASASLSARAGELQSASQNLSGNTEQNSSKIQLIDAAADEVTAGVHAVAGGAEQMGAAIREIAMSATEAATVASEAVQSAGRAEQVMAKLGASSAEIDSVVKAITAIAEQTNLLALNATIEAARAGETGKGFAVVAGEVKDLAQETAKATEEISRRIEAIQSDTRIAVDAISGIGQVIGRINDYQNTIASAVEQQSATTNSMSSDLSRAATGTSQISSQLDEVVKLSDSTRAAAQSTQTAADELARISQDLDTTVSSFRY